jgi:hypothetical protein
VEAGQGLQGAATRDPAPMHSVAVPPPRPNGLACRLSNPPRFLDTTARRESGRGKCHGRTKRPTADQPCGHALRRWGISRSRETYRPFVKTRTRTTLEPTVSAPIAISHPVGSALAVRFALSSPYPGYETASGPHLGLYGVPLRAFCAFRDQRRARDTRGALGGEPPWPLKIRRPNRLRGSTPLSGTAPTGIAARWRDTPELRCRRL